MNTHGDGVFASTDVLLAQLAVATVFGHVSQNLSLLPGWVGGILGGLIVAVVTRILAPTLDVHGQRLKKRWAASDSIPPPAPTPVPEEPRDTPRPSS